MHRNGDSGARRAAQQAWDEARSKARREGVSVPAWLRDVRRITAEREIAHDEYCDADEVRDRCRAAWWGGFLWGTAAGIVALIVACSI